MAHRAVADRDRQDTIQVQGTIQAHLPRGLYRVRLDDGHTVTATVGRELRRVLVRLTPGDRVLVEPSEVDPTRGRITEKQK